VVCDQFLGDHTRAIDGLAAGAIDGLAAEKGTLLQHPGQ
jgi:hypothetical protein